MKMEKSQAYKDETQYIIVIAIMMGFLSSPQPFAQLIIPTVLALELP